MPAESPRDIKRRIASIRNTQQITKAMEIVAATKLRRAQGQVVASRPFAGRLEAVLGRLVASYRAQGGGAGGPEHPLLTPREVQRVCYVVITGDRGLAGGYNVNVLRAAEARLREEGRPYQVVAVGRKGRDHLRRRGYPLSREYVFIGDEIDWNLARDLSRSLAADFEAGACDEVHLIYNTFVSAAVHRPTVRQLLPVAEVGPAPGGAGEPGGPGEYLYEPSPGRVLAILVPRYVDTLVYRALMEAKASEHGARMTAMHAATNNASEMIRELTLSYNRARQAAITKEISEIVGGAEALTEGAV